MGEVLNERRKSVEDRLEALDAELRTAKQFAGHYGCVYLTGSFARGEAGRHSDLDLFIIGSTDDAGRRRLRRLDEICLKAELIKASNDCSFPEFSGDGEWLVHHTVRDLEDKLGQPEDDSQNTFTARMLLLLESRPLIGETLYREALDDIIAAYWADFEDHADDFVPSFLANDILRMWRTFCVNYEARTQRAPAAKKAKRKLKNYKLKHSRLLTCYSALAYLLDVHVRRRTVSPDDARKMVSLTPTQRLEQLIESQGADVRHQVETLIGLYERFLEQTDATENELVERFLDGKRSRQLRREAAEFGDSMFDLLHAVGQGDSLYRMLVV